jgi:hypothetical protein
MTFPPGTPVKWTVRRTAGYAALVAAMDTPRRRLKLGDREFEGTPIAPTSSQEFWNEYLLDDGTVVRVKLVATEFLRVDGQFDADGNPVYVVKSTNVMSIQSPEALKKR